MGYVRGMWGTGDWATGQRPQNWREAILKEFPNGDAPLTALRSLMKSKSTDDYLFNWFEKTLAAQAGGITNIYTDALMANELATGQATVSGVTLYIKVALNTAKEIREGHQVLLRYSDDYTVDVNAKVVDVVQNAANSRITVKLLEADNNSNNYDLYDADRILIIGNINPQGGAIPTSIGYTPTRYDNYTQIFRTPLNITRTALQTRLRTGNEYKERKIEALQYHSIEMEKAFMWGIQTSNTASNGEPETTTRGLIPNIKLYASSNVSDYTQESAYSAQTWTNGGEDWLDSMLEQIFRYGSMDRLAYCGSGALLGINQLVKNNGMYQLKEGSIGYGIKVMKWTTAFGTINLKRHPLFSYETTNRHSMVIFQPEDIVERPIQQTKYFKDSKDTTINYDGLKEEFLTETGLEFHFPLRMGYLNGVGKVNVV